uniref:Myosin_tail_1 domain-containing protein n=1 Tax=Ascaris lumbricoides TaxID=6252 RepID=A0A0M3IM36_ASCLU
LYFKKKLIYYSEIKRLQKEKLTSDGESVARENSLTDQLFNQSLLIDKKLNQIDETIAQKDQLIEDLRNKLNDAEIQLKRCNESISDALKTKEELLIELNSLRNESHKKEDETHLSIEKLKWERDRALQHLADIRKSKGSGDTNMIEEIKKLEITIRNRDVEIQIQLKRCNESISDALKTKEELLIELNSLRNESHKKEDETHLSIEKLKWERDRALQHLADIRKSKGSGDTNMIEEIKKLEITIRNRDVEIRKIKEHYRRLLTKMKSSLLRAEKQIALLNGKFDANE